MEQMKDWWVVGEKEVWKGENMEIITRSERGK